MKNVKKIIEKLAPSFSLQELETATANYKRLEKWNKREAESLLEVASESYVPADFKRLVADELRLDLLDPEMAHALANGLYQFKVSPKEPLTRLSIALKRGHGVERFAAEIIAANQWEKAHGKIDGAETVDEVILAVPELRACAVSNVVRCLRDMGLERYREEIKRTFPWVKFGGDNGNA